MKVERNEKIHELHNDITDITLEMLKAENNQKNLWNQFLITANQLDLVCPRSIFVPLDLSQEIALFSNPENRPSITVQEAKDLSEDEYQEIAAIYNEAFNFYEEFRCFHYTSKAIKTMTASRDTVFLIARDEKTRAILGVVEYELPDKAKKTFEKEQYNSEDVYGGYIANFARKASAARLNIGKILMQNLLDGPARNEEMIHLHVYEKNRAAQNFYKKFGFYEQPLYQLDNITNTYPNDNRLFMSYKRINH